MSKALQTNDVLRAVRRLLVKGGANAALWVAAQGKTQKLCAACHFPGFGWFSLDGTTPVNEMVDLLKLSDCEFSVEQLDESTEGAADVRAMQVRLGLLVELG